MEKIFIVDAVNYLFRSYYAIGPMTNDKGESTSALYGFIASIRKIIKDFSPKYLVAVFDGQDNKKERRAVFAEYKMHRKGAPADLYPQIERAFEFCELFGIPALSIPEVEADDTMATIAEWSAKDGLEAYICTTDKDLFQMVSKHIFVLNVHKDNLLIDAAKVKEIFGVEPGQMLDYLSLVGDASDNIPGVEGFGPKTAAQLLGELGSLDYMLDHPEKISGKKGQTLQEQKDKALLSKRLATLNLQVEIPTHKDFYLLKEPNLERLRPFCHEMKFMKLLHDLESVQEVAPAAEEEKHHYHVVNNEDTLDKLLPKLLEEKEITLDTETTGLNPLLSTLVGIGLGYRANEAWYIPFNGSIPQDKIIHFLKTLLHKVSVYGHNLKYDYHILSNYGIEIKKIVFDTILASYLLNPQNRQHNLDRLALEQFNKVKIPTKDLIGEGKKQITMAEVPIEKVAEYCCEDVDYTCRLKKVFEHELKARDLNYVMYDIEMPLLPILAKMERHGMFIDQDIFEKLSKELHKELDLVEKAIYKDAGKEFNINSPKQLSDVLFVDLKLPQPKKGVSTAADVLEKLEAESPIVTKILKYRGLQKLLSTYVDVLPQEVNPNTQRIHPSFSQSTTATGRLSCQDPNLQNIPIRSPDGKKIREGFKPQKEHWSFLSADYSQIELRLVAHFSEDPNLTKAFQEGQDIHAYTASLVFKVPINEVTYEMRQIAKTVNFGILYGQGAFGLSQQLKISTHEAANFIQTYFERYPKVQAFIEQCKAEVEKTGIAKTLTGRQRPISEIHNKNPSIRAAAQRLAINTPLQGTAADIIKLAMIAIDKVITEEKLEGFMVLQIHDELIFEIPDKEVPIFKKFVKEKMENVLMLNVPMLVDLSVGKNWGEC